MKGDSDIGLMAYRAADRVRRRRRRDGHDVGPDEMGRMVTRAFAVLRRFNTINRMRVNRGNVAGTELGGEA